MVTPTFNSGQSGTIPDNGLIIIDKPRGPTSHQVTAWTGEILHAQVGHSGTLDPAVTGVLVVMTGRAVKFAPLLQRGDKEYIALMRLHADVGWDDLSRVAGEFTGRIYQRPPKKSAVARALRIRTVHSLDLLEQEGRLVLMRVHCDAGTYIRMICHHMGLALGVGAHLQELRRTRSGPFTEADAHSLHEVKDAAVMAQDGDPTWLAEMIVPPGRGIPGVPRVKIRDSAVDAICHGALLAGVGVISNDPFRKGETVAVVSMQDEVVCLGRALTDSSSWKPGTPGFVIASSAVIMESGRYPKGWRTARKKSAMNEGS